MRRLTREAGVDAILDIVGADYLAQNLALLKPRGRLVVLSTLGGHKAEIDLRQIMGRRLRLIGSVLRSRSLAEKVAVVDAFRQRFWPDVEAGRLKPLIDSVYPIADVTDANQRMAANQNIGKIVLAIKG